MGATKETKTRSPAAQAMGAGEQAGQVGAARGPRAAPRQHVSATSAQRRFEVSNEAAVVEGWKIAQRFVAHDSLLNVSLADWLI